MNEHIQWAKEQFDKVLLAILSVLCIILTIRALHHAPPDAALVTWLENLTSSFTGALLVLITRAQAAPPKV